MNLDTALDTIADRFGLDARELIAYASEDTIGGYSFDPTQSKWPGGSIWAVDGQVLYALTRATKPALVVQLGGWRGCSTAHFAAALAANGKGRLISVDRYPEPAIDAANTHVSYWTGDALDFLRDLKANTCALVYEDIGHGLVETRDVWTLAMQKVKKGGYVVSHDSEHTTGQDDGALVRAGIEAAGVSDYLSMLIEPGDCGLAIARRE